jgi:sialic acid synthase SpsE
MVDGIRNVEKALGDGLKRLMPSELTNLPMARKSIIASLPIKTGDIFTEHNLTAKRPGTGISPMEWNKVLGRKANRDYLADELIDES